MTLSTLDPAPLEGDPPSFKATEYHHDLRLEIGAKEGREVPVVSIFYDLVKRMKAAADDGKPMVVLTATDQIFNEQRELPSDEFKKAFKVDKIEGKFPKVLSGFKIRTMTKLYDIKQRLISTYLHAHDLYLREHVGGFHGGVKVFSYGFLKDDHPDHPDINALSARFAKWIADAWQKMSNSDKQKWKEDLPNAFYGPSGIAIPVNFSKERLSAAMEGKAKITTTALMVTSPSQYGKLLRELLDSAVLNKRINNLIPLAFHKEDPDGYYKIIANQERFMENHRNIPIMHIPPEAAAIHSTKGTTLIELLNGNKDIQRVSHDAKQGKYHVSTSASKYKTVHQWIGKTLAEHKFHYAPYIRPLKYGQDSTTKFSTVLSTAMSVVTASETESTNTKNTRNAPWKQRPPLNISYVLSQEAFPPLPKSSNQNPVSPSTASETLDEDTIHSAISSALAKLEAKHKADLESLKQEMNSKLAAVENQMKEISKQVAAQTYEALVNEASPLATKSDQVHMQHEINMISTQLATLIQMMKPAQNEIATPPRTGAKRSKLNRTPEKTTGIQDLITQDNEVPSTTSDLDEGMEGCEE